MAETDECHSNKPLLPLFLDTSQRLVVIFGGGKVAERKAALFSDYGPVRVVSQEFTAGLMAMTERLELIHCDLTHGFAHFLRDAFIAIPATSSTELNRAIEKAACGQGILVNRVEGRGDVVVPSILRKGQIAIAISTESPGLTRYLRLRLEEELTEKDLEMAKLLGQLRPELKKILPSQEERARAIRGILADEEIWGLLDVSYEKAYMRARSHALQNERDNLDAGDASHSLHR